MAGPGTSCEVAWAPSPPSLARSPLLSAISPLFQPQPPPQGRFHHNQVASARSTAVSEGGWQWVGGVSGRGWGAGWEIFSFSVERRMAKRRPARVSLPPRPPNPGPPPRRSAPPPPQIQDAQMDSMIATMASRTKTVRMAAKGGGRGDKKKNARVMWWWKMQPHPNKEGLIGLQMVFPTSTPRTHLPGRSPAPCAGLRPRKQDTKKNSKQITTKHCSPSSNKKNEAGPRRGHAGQVGKRHSSQPSHLSLSLSLCHHPTPPARAPSCPAACARRTAPAARAAQSTAAAAQRGAGT